MRKAALVVLVVLLHAYPGQLLNFEVFTRKYVLVMAATGRRSVTDLVPPFCETPLRPADQTETSGCLSGWCATTR